MTSQAPAERASVGAHAVLASADSRARTVYAVVSGQRGKCRALGLTLVGR